MMAIDWGNDVTVEVYDDDSLGKKVNCMDITGLIL